MTAPRAAVDVGSNSVRLLVVDGEGRRLTRELTITRLGAGVDATGHLDDDALQRTLEVLERYRRKWAELGVDGRVRIAATSAVRDAADRDRFFTGVRAVTGVDAEVLSGEQEAALAFRGAAVAVGAASPAAVIDIGGGSTELVVGRPPEQVEGSVSLQLGCVRLTERVLANDPPTSEQLAAANALIDEQLELADEILDRQGVSVHEAVTLVAVAGTATTLAALHLELATYEEDRIHRTRLPAASLRRLTKELVSLPAGSRGELGPVQPGREDVIHGGALVLDRVVRRYGFEAVTVSEADNLDGLVASLA